MIDHAIRSPIRLPPRTAAVDRPPCDHVLLRTSHVTLGAFRCAVDHPGFATEGPITHHIVAFPRTAVWIEHESHPAFVADPGVATIYNPGQPYLRHAISPAGDRTDWIGLSESLAREVIRELSPRHAERVRLFGFPRLEVTSADYLEQSRLFALAAAGGDPAMLEERAITLAGAVLERGFGASAPVAAAPRAGSRRLAERARALICESLGENRPATELASALGVSVYHLCRSFRAATGLTMQEYRIAMRLRSALHEIPARAGRIAALAVDLGFHSHSHFTSAFRREFGIAPSRARVAALRA